MTNIDIDFEVFQKLTMLRQSEKDGYNDVMRRLLKLPNTTDSRNSSKGLEWVSKGYRFPEGTEFKSEFGGKEYFAEIQNGKLLYNGKEYGSFSGAAKVITGSQRNGWDFWQQRQLGGRWRKLY